MGLYHTSHARRVATALLGAAMALGASQSAQAATCASVCSPQRSCASACDVVLEETERFGYVTQVVATTVQSMTCGDYGLCDLFGPPVMMARRANAACEARAEGADGLVHYQKTELHGDSFGSDDFGAGYSVRAHFEAAASDDESDRSTFRGEVSGSAWGKVFGNQRELASGRVESTARYHDADSVDFTAELRIGGQQVFRATKGTGPTSGNPSISRTVFSVDRNIPLGPALLNVQARAQLKANLDYRVHWGLASEANVQATPHFEADAVLAAAVGATIDAAVVEATLRAGVEGALVLLDVALPATLSVGMRRVSGHHQLAWSWNVPLHLTTLAGDLSVFVESKLRICLPWVGCYTVVGHKWSTEIAEFGGFSTQRTLTSGEGCVSLPEGRPARARFAQRMMRRR